MGDILTIIGQWNLEILRCRHEIVVNDSDWMKLELSCFYSLLNHSFHFSNPLNFFDLCVER
jgi:hypothetical protein